MTTPHIELLIIAVLILLVGFIGGWLATSRTTLVFLNKLRDVSAERTRVVQGYVQRENQDGETIRYLRNLAEDRRLQLKDLKDELNITLRQATAVDDAHEDALDALRAVPVAFRADETQLLRVVSKPIPQDATVAYGLAEPPRWPDSHSGLYSQVPVDPYDGAADFPNDPSDSELSALIDVFKTDFCAIAGIDVPQTNPTRLDLFKALDDAIGPPKLLVPKAGIPIGQRRDYPAKPLPGKKTRRKIKAGAR